MKLRSLLSLVAVVALFSSCGINDLEDRLDKVEHALGNDEPIRVDFTTTYNDQEIAKKGSYSFKTDSYNSSYLYDNQDGYYYIFIQRFSEISGENDAWIEFEYNSETKEVSDASAYLEFRDQFGNRINPTFNPEYTGHTFELKVHSFNAETGKVEVEVIASTDETASNEYDTPMSVNMKFKGKLDVFLD